MLVAVDDRPDDVRGDEIRAAERAIARPAATGAGLVLVTRYGSLASPGDAPWPVAA